MIEQDGAGDAAMNFRITGVTDWGLGIDNSDSDMFKIDPGSLAFGDPAFGITTGNLVRCYYNLQVDTTSTFTGNAEFGGNISGSSTSLLLKTT